VTHDDITADHARRILKWLTPDVDRMIALRERMIQTGFPLDDPMYIVVRDAAAAARALKVALDEKALPEWSKRSRGS
jgi:hypothetical protein